MGQSIVAVNSHITIPGERGVYSCVLRVGGGGGGRWGVGGGSDASKEVENECA